MNNDLYTARNEIHKTLRLCNVCTRCMGISFIDDEPSNLYSKLKIHLTFVITTTAVVAMVAGEIAYVTSLLLNSTSVAEFVASLHIVGYGCMSIGKVMTLWYKSNIFRQLVRELAEIWPVSIKDNDALEIKQTSLTALRLSQLSYSLFNILGLLFYNVTPIVVFLYQRFISMQTDLGYVWHINYPFDKSKPVNHALAYIFEAYAGLGSVWAMLGTDLMFTTMASHICMLLRVLQVKIRNFATTESPSAVEAGSDLTNTCDCYADITSAIKIHQRLIKYANDLEDAFSVSNLINVILSSINICCVMFSIVFLDPWMEISNKLFLGAALTQVGILCWYADDIYRASIGVADAAFESGWYKSNIRCRHALLLLIQRSQKPLYFTSMKFHAITLTTYTSILTTSYSYFTLLYTAYRSNDE